MVCCAGGRTTGRCVDIGPAGHQDESASQTHTGPEAGEEEQGNGYSRGKRSEEAGTDMTVRIDGRAAICTLDLEFLMGASPSNRAAVLRRFAQAKLPPLLAEIDAADDLDLIICYDRDHSVCAWLRLDDAWQAGPCGAGASLTLSQDGNDLSGVSWLHGLK